MAAAAKKMGMRAVRIEPRLLPSVDAPANQSAVFADVTMTDSTNNNLFVDVTGCAFPHVGCSCPNLTPTLAGVKLCRNHCIMPALITAEEKKNKWYLVKNKLSDQVVPFAFSYGGVLGPAASKFLSQMSAHRSMVKNDALSTSSLVLKGVLGCALTRQIARNFADAHGSMNQRWVPLG
jgi:hypothetical protein